MLFETPDTLEPVKLSSTEDGRVFALCHPFMYGLQDDEVSLIFEIRGATGRLIGRFDFCMNAMECHQEQLCLTDDDNTLHLFDGTGWRAVEDAIESPPSQICKMRSISGQLLGLTSEGTIHLWDESGWAEFAQTGETDFLYDIIDWPGQGLTICGANGLIARVGPGRVDPLDLPVTSEITSLLGLSDGRLVATGWNGTVLVLDGDELLPVGTGRRNALLTAVAWQQEVLISADTEILRLVLPEVETWDTTDAFRLSVLNGQLWKIGIRSVGFRSGDSWTPVPLAAEITF